MSVVPLTIDPPSPTVVEGQEYFSPERHRVLIVGLDKLQLSSKDDANTSYDLRVGAEYRDHREQGERDTEAAKSISLPPGAALIIQTEEFIHLPGTMFGIIAPKVSLLQRGVSNTFSKVDPGYQGHLLISLFNLGKATIELQRGDPFCALPILEVAGRARLYNKQPKQINGRSALAPIQRFSDWLESQGVYLALVMAIGTAVLAMMYCLG
jgi:dCTP deaminase